jgi:DNA-binding HxlR family transcriptional regulator
MSGKSNLELSKSLLEQVADKWTILILAALCRNGGRCRFNAIRREVDGLSQKTLTHCLRKLERNGLIERRILDLAPIGVEYAVTPLGHTLKAPFEALYAWVQLYLPEVEAARAGFDDRAADGATGFGRDVAAALIAPAVPAVPAVPASTRPREPVRG